MATKIGDNSATSVEQLSLAKLKRDFRSPRQRLIDQLRAPYVIPFGLVSLLTITCLYPALLFVTLPLALWLKSLQEEGALPFNLPFDSNALDKNDIEPGTIDKPSKAAGRFLVGWCATTGAELWLRFNNLLRHVLVFGTTGAGKTETLVSFATNFLAIGGGVSYSDAKASVKLAVQMMALARYFGRDYDIRFMNYQQSSASSDPDYARRSSNTASLFARGPADKGIQLVLSLLPTDKGGGGGNKVFQEAAVGLINAIYPALVEKRDAGVIDITPDLVREYLSYQKTCELMLDPTLSSTSRREIEAYISNLPGFDKTRPLHKQQEECTKQFGYAQMYFKRSLASLSGTYGHIYMAGKGEVDFQDVMFQDRILVTMLPSLEKAGEELANLGKIILSALRNAMAEGLGELEGWTEQTMGATATSSDRPFGFICDEYAYMAVEDFAITAAQGRGLNCVMFFGGQDYPGFKRAGERDADQIIANTRLKYIMAQEDFQTVKLVKDLLGDAYTAITSGHKVKDGKAHYSDTLQTSIQKVDRISQQDVRKLPAGTGFSIFEDSLTLTRNFHHGLSDSDLVKIVPLMRATRMLSGQYHPSRGPLVDVLDPLKRGLANNIRIWLDHMDDDDIDSTSGIEAPKIFEPVVATIDTDGYRSLPEYLRGQYLFGKSVSSFELEDDMFDDDEEDGSEGLFSNQAGTFANEFKKAEPDPQNDEGNFEQEVANIRSFFDSISASSPRAAPLPITNRDEGELPDNADDFINDDDEIQVTESLFGKASLNSVADGIESIELALGTDAKKAKSIGKETSSSLADVTSYPKVEPKPKKGEAKQDQLTAILRDFIATNIGDDDDDVD